MRKRTESKLMSVDVIFILAVKASSIILTVSAVPGQWCVRGLIDIVPWNIWTTVNASDLEV